MKRTILFVLLAVATISLHAQQDSANAYVDKFQTIPSFNIHCVPDSSFYNSQKLKPGAPFMMMFFSPDCDHCQHQVKEMMAYKKELSELQIVMISPLSYPDNKTFYEEYNIASMPNIKMGTDPSNKLRMLYKVHTYPAMYVYDKSGKLAKAFLGNVDISRIIDATK